MNVNAKRRNVASREMGDDTRPRRSKDEWVVKTTKPSEAGAEPRAATQDVASVNGEESESTSV